MQNHSHSKHNPASGGSAAARKRHKTKRPGIFYREGADGQRRYCVGYRDSRVATRDEVRPDPQDAVNVIPLEQAKSATGGNV
jgi:hypothetical protein